MMNELTSMKETVDTILTAAFNYSASDIHFSVGVPPIFRVHGDLKRYGKEINKPQFTEDIAKTVIPETLYEDFLEKGQLDFSYAVHGISRFRVNAYRQRGSVSLAFRTIPTKIMSVEDLGMPEVLKELSETPQGLILVTGPTGSGKSTTLAAMIRHINEKMRKHIITLEDPIEFVHNHGTSIIDQREVGFDTDSFADGLRAALRQDPDVILVGEMRDLETISIAITAAETGHLVFGTLHTWSAASTIDRIIDVFPSSQQTQIRIQLAGVLKAVISQRLFKTKDGKGRRAATEIMINNPAIGNLIRTEKIHQIPSVIQTNRAAGMHTMSTSVQALVDSGALDREIVKGYLESEDH